MEEGRRVGGGTLTRLWIRSFCSRDTSSLCSPSTGTAHMPASTAEQSRCHVRCPGRGSFSVTINTNMLCPYSRHPASPSDVGTPGKHSAFGAKLGA